MAKRTSAPPAPWMTQTLQQGLDFLNAGNPRQAADCAGRVLQARQDSPEAHFLIGLIALQCRQQPRALQAFGAVVQVDPQNCAAWAHMAEIYVAVDEPTDAIKALEKAIEHDDGSPNAHQLIAMVTSSLGDHEKALTWFDKASRQEPNNSNVLINHANCLMYVGKISEAEALLRNVLQLQPGHPYAHWLLSGLIKAESREHVDEMEKLIEPGRYAPRDLAFMNYACGKELEDLEEWDEAFHAYSAGAHARRKTVSYDEQAEIEMYATLERIYTCEWLSEGAPGHEDAAPIFVVGQPRTGTTLVERIMTAHSHVNSAGELRNLANQVRRLTNCRDPGRFSTKLVTQAASVDFEALGRAYIQSTQRVRGETPHFVDKLPSNFLFVPLILKALPNAKIVHLRRNPMDACFASFKQLFTDAYPHSYDQEEMARHHARYYHLMSIWRERFGDCYLELRYEDVARDVEPNARALIDFLGLPWEDACLDFASQRSAVATASAVQVRQPVHTKSIGRWHRYENHLEPMRAVLTAHAVPLDLL